MKDTRTTTEKAEDLINRGMLNKKELAEELGISRPTLDTRLAGKSSWKKLETKWVSILATKNKAVV